MSVWTRKPDGSYSATFPVAGKKSYVITVSEDEFADEEFDNGKGQFLPLKEGRFYHYEISSGGKLAAGSSFVRGSAGSSGRLAPATAVGYGRLWLDGHTDPSEALDVEVVSEVIGYKDDYEKLLSQLTGYVADLQMQCASDVQYLVGEDYDREPDPKHKLQTYFFLLGLVNDANFDQAVRRIVESPYARLRTLETEQDIRHATRFSAAMLRQVASASRRIAAPAALCERGLPTVPERIFGAVREETVDVPENRFVKHVLTNFRGKLQEFRDDIDAGKLKSKAKNLYQVELDVSAATDRLDRWLASDFFRGVGQLTSMPSSSVVLQRREGYRDILKKWLQSQAASKMKWDAMEDVHRENQKDVATLYEYWCFFRLLDIVKDLFHIENDNLIQSLVGFGTDGLSLKVNEGKQLNPPLSGSYVSGHTSQRYRKLDIEFQYNRRFSNTKTSKASWTVRMIPDYTISFRPQGMSIEQAEQLDLISYVHFDAKYKAKDVVSALSNTEDENEVADNAEMKREKDVKKVDVLKMHAYRDAIPRTAGAYILYPNPEKTDKHDYRYGDEILPGLGAFSLYPKDDNSDDEPIKTFLSSVAEYLCDRITRWENLTYQQNIVFAGSHEEWAQHQAYVAKQFRGVVDVPDVKGGRFNLTAVTDIGSLPPERFMHVNIGADKTRHQGRWDQAKWIREHRKFVFSTGRKFIGTPEEKLMIIALWMPPFSMLVWNYCGIRTRADLEVDGPLPFPGREFYVWDVSLHNFDHVVQYLNEHPNGPVGEDED